MRRLTIFNWKENPKNLRTAKDLFEKIIHSCPNIKELAIAVPFPYLKNLIEIKKEKSSLIQLASQDLSKFEEGAHTGEVSASMLKNLGINYSIIGHSERRYGLDESDYDISKKIINAQKNKITPILCIGEVKKISSIEKSVDFIKKQIISDTGGKISNIIFAYEPVWAIGGKIKIDPKRIAKIVTEIKKFLKNVTKTGGNRLVLYGGSVNCNNISDLVKYKDIDGFLIGSSSLKEKDVKFITKIIYN